MRLYHWGLAAALIVATATVARAEPETAEPSHSSCFSLSEWHGWKADGDQTLYFKVRMHDVYRIDLSEKEGFLNAPGMHLVTKSWGSDMVCNPIDLDIKIADNYPPGMANHLFVKAITKLTPEEIAALPEKVRP